MPAAAVVIAAAAAAAAAALAAARTAAAIVAYPACAADVGEGAAARRAQALRVCACWTQRGTVAAVVGAVWVEGGLAATLAHAHTVPPERGESSVKG